MKCSYTTCNTAVLEPIYCSISSFLRGTTKKFYTYNFSTCPLNMVRGTNRADI